MNHIRIDNNYFRLPKSLNDLTEKQLHSYIACRFSGLSPFESQLVFLKSLVNTKINRVLRDLSAVQLTEIVALLDWLHEPLPLKPLFEKFTFDGVVYYAPQERMSTSVIAEYINCDNALMSYEVDELYLEKLTAFLYRPADSSKEFGDIREKMNTDKTIATATAFKRLPITYKIAALGFFVEIKQFIASAYKEVFEKEEEEGLVESSWGTTLMKIAETQVNGKLEDVKFTNIYEIFGYLKLKKQEHQEAEYKRKTKKYEN